MNAQSGDDLKKEWEKINDPKNYNTMKDGIKFTAFIFVVLIVIVAMSFGCWTLERWINWKFGYKPLDASLKVEWIGKPLLHDMDIKEGFVIKHAEQEIGLREDGVIVWRKLDHTDKKESKSEKLIPAEDLTPKIEQIQ